MRSSRCRSCKQHFLELSRNKSTVLKAFIAWVSHLLLSFISMNAKHSASKRMRNLSAFCFWSHPASGEWMNVVFSCPPPPPHHIPLMPALKNVFIRQNRQNPPPKIVLATLHAKRLTAGRAQYHSIEDQSGLAVKHWVCRPVDLLA